jgi:hypothetical protein
MDNDERKKIIAEKQKRLAEAIAEQVKLACEIIELNHEIRQLRDEEN